MAHRADHVNVLSGFVLRDDLCARINKLSAFNGIQDLSAAIQVCDSMLIDEDEFCEIVQHWMEEPATATETLTKPRKALVRGVGRRAPKGGKSRFTGDPRGRLQRECLLSIIGVAEYNEHSVQLFQTLLKSAEVALCDDGEGLLLRALCLHLPHDEFMAQIMTLLIESNPAAVLSIHGPEQERSKGWCDTEKWHDERSPLQVLLSPKPDGTRVESAADRSGATVQMVAAMLQIDPSAATAVLTSDCLGDSNDATNRSTRYRSHQMIENMGDTLFIKPTTEHSVQILRWCSMQIRSHCQYRI